MINRPAPPQRVPTLTEVIAPAAGDLPASDSVGDVPPQAIDASAIARQISADLQAHIDRVLDARVAAALEPVLQQTLARVVEETRRELASTLRDGIARAIAQQNLRHRSGP